MRVAMLTVASAEAERDTIEVFDTEEVAIIDVESDCTTDMLRDGDEDAVCDDMSENDEAAEAERETAELRDTVAAADFVDRILYDAELDGNDATGLDEGSVEIDGIREGSGDDEESADIDGCRVEIAD